MSERWGGHHGMFGRVITSTRINDAIISTTHHPHNDIYLTRIFGGFLSNEWGSSKTRYEADRMHERFCNWKRRMGEMYGL